jgi:hypothetical protein
MWNDTNKNTYQKNGGTMNDDQTNKALSAACIEPWASSLLFSDTGSVKPGSPGGKVCQHLTCHRIKAVMSGSTLQDSANLSEISLIPGGQGEHQVTQDLLSDVQDV